MTDETREQIEDEVNRLMIFDALSNDSSYMEMYTNEYTDAKNTYRRGLMALVNGGMSVTNAIQLVRDIQGWGYRCGREDGYDERF